MARTVSQSDTVPKRIAATCLALFIVVVVALSLLMFVRAFDNRVPLTVRSDRAGLVMDVDAAVRSRGVEIGNVTGIRQEFDGATLDIEVDPTALEAIPANADVSIGSNTIFGAKAVNFDPPAQPADTSLESGTVVETSNVTAAMNTLFEDLTALLQAVEPEKLNSTLCADVSPDLMRMLDSSTDVGTNVLNNQARFEHVLASPIGTGETGKRLLAENGDELVKTLSDLRASASLAAEYSPMLTCLIVG